MIGLSGLIMTTDYYLLAVLPAVAAIAGVIFFLHPLYFYYIILILIPYGQYRFKMDWVITLGLVIVLFIYSLSNKNEYFLKRRSLFPYVAIFFTYFILSGLFSPYRDITVINIVFLTFSLLFYFYTIHFVTDKKQFTDTIPKLIVWSVSICSFAAVLGYFFNVSYFAESVDGGFKRGIGTTRDPNSLALLIIFTIPLVIYLILRTKTRWAKMIYILFFFVNLLAMQTTFSRSGALAVCIVLVFVFGKKIKNIVVRQLGLIISFSLLSLVLLLLFVPPSYWERQKSLGDSGDKAVGRRMSYLIVGWESIKEHPLLGTGPGSFPEIYALSSYAQKFSKKDQSNKRFAHNSYMEIAVGTGVVGFAFFVAILIKTFVNFYTSHKRAMASANLELAVIIEAYRNSYAGLLLYLATISNPYHKFLMLSFAISEIAVLLTQKKDNN